MITYSINDETGFDAANKNAKFVFVGITPGSASNYRADGTIKNKFEAAFSGSKGLMRKNIWKMLLHVLKQDTHPEIKQLFDAYQSVEDMFIYTEDSIVDFTSLLKKAVTFSDTEKGIENENFNRVKEIISCKKASENETKKLKKLFEEGFLYDCINVYDKEVIYIACGRQVYDFLIKNAKINQRRVIAIVHPSTQARDYINRFLGEGGKPYNPEKLY